MFALSTSHRHLNWNIEMTEEMLKLCQICSSVHLFAPSQHRSIGTNDVPPGGVVRLQPWRTWWSRRSSSWRPLLSSVSLWSQNRQQNIERYRKGISLEISQCYFLKSCGTSLTSQDGTDASQGKGQIISNINACQAVQTLVHHLSWSPPCHPVSSTRLWASSSPPWDLVVWTSWLKKVVAQPSPTMVQQWWRSWISSLRKQPVKSALHKGWLYTDTHCDIIESYSLAFCSKTTRFEACIILQFVIIMSDMSLLIL